MFRLVTRNWSAAVAALAVGLSGALVGSPACANLMFQLGNNPQPDEQNILFAAPQTGTTITGEVDHATPTIPVVFNTLTGQTLQQTAQGQADIFNLAGTPLTSMETSIPGFGFTDFIMNPNNGTGTALVTATDNMAQTFTYMLGPGQNFLTIVAVAGSNEVITDVKIQQNPGTTGFGFNDFKQPRVSGVCTLGTTGCTPVVFPPVVPEPASLAILGSALVGFGAFFGWRRRSLSD